MAKRKEYKDYDNMSTEARELMLYAENDAQLYRQMYQPIIKNYIRKINKGMYNQQLAIKGWLNFVNAAAKKYVNEHGTRGARIDSIFSVEDRRDVARYFEDESYTEISLGNWDSTLKVNPDMLEESVDKSNFGDNLMEESQTKVRGSNKEEYQTFLDNADDGKGGDITNNGKPLPTYDEWLKR